MKWYHYVAAIAAGFFLGNALSHLTAGVTGQMFPSPFSDPPTIGLSTPLVNTLWGLVNLLLGYTLFRVSKASPARLALMFAVFVGFACVTIYSSIHFGAVMGNSSL